MMNTIQRRVGLWTITLFVLATTSALAAPRSWDGGAGDNFWASANNWNPDGFATSDDLTVNSTVVLATGSGSVNVTGSGSLTIATGGDLDVTTTGDLTLHNNATLNILGTMRRTNGNWFRFGNAGSLNATINHSGSLLSNAPPMIAFNQSSGSGQATYNMTGGVLTSAREMVLGWSYSTNTGNMIGMFNQSGNADVNIGTTVQLGVSNGANTVSGTGSGYYNLSGGTLDATAIQIGAWSSAATNNGASTGLFTQTGGTIGGTTRPNVQIALGAPSTGTYVMRGGILKANNLTDNGSGGTAMLKVQGGAGTIDVSGAMTFTGANSTLAVEIGSTGLTPINVTGTGTANVGTSTKLTAGVYGGAGFNSNNTFTLLQVATGSVSGTLVDQTGPLWDIASSPASRIDLTLAAAAERAQLNLGTGLVTGLNDSFGWVDVLPGSYTGSAFPLGITLAGSGSESALATWMTSAGLNAVADEAASMIVLRDLPTPVGQSDFFWDFSAYNAANGTSFAVTGLQVVPEPSSLALFLSLAVFGPLTYRARRWGRRRVGDQVGSLCDAG
jgi:hypothetical protein